MCNNMGFSESIIAPSTYLHLTRPRKGFCAQWAFSYFADRTVWDEYSQPTLLTASWSPPGVLSPEGISNPRSQLETSEASPLPCASCWAHNPELGRKSLLNNNDISTALLPCSKLCIGASEVTRPPILLEFPLLVLIKGLGGGAWVEARRNGNSGWNERQLPVTLGSPHWRCLWRGSVSFSYWGSGHGRIAPEGLPLCSLERGSRTSEVAEETIP